MLYTHPVIRPSIMLPMVSREELAIVQLPHKKNLRNRFTHLKFYCARSEIHFFTPSSSPISRKGKEVVKIRKNVAEMISSKIISYF
ncbi:hypothetical protein KC19_2G151200 [Ceratodon purpureus]|uniref:Uncharacterized protein n=1 Tax=Ceratodon purpureus TaxID=3225 RepID=A0A8T0IWN1_CERPU|nr:hypothetical protein KC19_2G151200 [Ceratodon purpureus]